jgi:hypothetical protein
VRSPSLQLSDIGSSGMVRDHHRRRNSAWNAGCAALKTPSSPGRLVPVWRVEGALPRWSAGVTASWLHHAQQGQSRSRGTEEETGESQPAKGPAGTRTVTA